MPEVYRDKRGTHYMVTQGGNKVGVMVDRRGRASFIDKAGDLFYDSGDPKVGFYVVRCLHAEGGAAQACTNSGVAALACMHVGGRSFSTMCVGHFAHLLCAKGGLSTCNCL